MRKSILLLSMIFTFGFITSCFKEDEQIIPHTPGNVISNMIELGPYYATQNYFDLSENRTVSSNPKDSWDLAFDCADSSLLIRLNGAKFMRASNYGDTTFFAISDTTNLNWNYDAASGNPDSIAVDNWFQINNNDTTFSQNTYLIDRGINALGETQGIRKLKILGYKNGAFTILFSNLNNSNLQTYTLHKDPIFNTVQIALEPNCSLMKLEPAKDNWDLLFSQYTDILNTSTGEKYPYLVTGVLLNPNKVCAILQKDINFESIELKDVEYLTLESRYNLIGYNWKTYDFDNGIYTVNPNLIYLITDTDGYYYKLRFIGFYNDLGEKGFPKFEFQRL